ncbi:hypothetical protein EDD18DRAFT_1083283 [Armillaria luteobubalina]|uniref:Uncharacterized protein n=1 Tax=Armillaria luteobubalina TaxID=153913 RepID=A0AA39PKH4_9AGAR|nr:hypothetical protein EDD18DRAFT_1083283 [Armillaria luteobubalina]
MKKLAAHDFEDILQCCIPWVTLLIALPSPCAFCFTSSYWHNPNMLSPHDETVADLLYLSMYWHALTKLRMHTDSSLAEFRLVTTGFTNALHHFTDVTCQAFDTVETDAKYAKRKHNEAQCQQKAGLTSVGTSTEHLDQRMSFNLSTLKAHAIADYPDQIEIFGTTDSYSMQIGELEHCIVKKWHGQMNKNKATKQLVKLNTVELIHNKMFAELQQTLSEDLKKASCADDTEDHTKPYRIAFEESP